MIEPEPGVRLRLAILEDHSILRESLTALLQRWEIDVVGEFSDGARFLAEVAALRPDVALIDLALEPGSSLSGLQVLERLRQGGCSFRSVVLSSSREASKIDAAYQLGVHAYLYKLDTSGEQLVQVIRAVHRGERLALPRSAELTFTPSALPAPAALASLTVREREVLAWVGTGFDNLKIAAHLDITERTVSAHLTALYRKLERDNRTELALLARELGLRPR